MKPDNKLPENNALNKLPRRTLLKSVGLGAGAAFLGGSLLRPGNAYAGVVDNINPGKITQTRKLDPNAGLSVILLGTGTPLPNPDRACASTLVIAGDKAILVDTGRGFLNRFADAGFQDASMVLFTHFHSDHFGELGELMETRSIWGANKPMPVIGPAGAKKTIESLLSAYALDNAYRKAHHKDKWNQAGMTADIRDADPGLVYDQDGLKILMFEVDHAPAIPAMAYRFDYKGHSVVISGDTKKTPQMTKNATGCDILVHEAANKAITEMGRQRLKDNPRLDAMTVEMLEYHTLTNEVAEIARDAGVKKLVLTHLVPSVPPSSVVERVFIKGMGGIYNGPIIVGRDGMEIQA